MPGTRAVRRQIEPGSRTKCAHCELDVKFVAKAGTANRKQVICNVYVDDKWSHVEHFHPDCYVDAGEPHGQVIDNGRGYT